MPLMSKKSCKKGYECGSSCISVTYMCRKEFPKGVSISIDGARRVILSNNEKEVLDLSSLKEESKLLGSGEFGLAYETPNGDILKEGMLGTEEIENLKLASKLGIAPKVLGHQITGDLTSLLNIPVKKGFLHMKKAPGESLFKKGYTEKEAENVIKALKTLNTNGVAHGDYHAGNTFSDNGKITLIDFGISRRGYLYALQEAVNLSSNRIILVETSRKIRNKIRENKEKLLDKMRQDKIPIGVQKIIKFAGIHDDQAIDEYMGNYGINNSKFKEYIDIMYEGI